MIKHYDRDGYEINPLTGARTSPSPRAVVQKDRSNEPITKTDVAAVLAFMVPLTLLVGWVAWLVIA